MWVRRLGPPVGAAALLLAPGCRPSPPPLAPKAAPAAASAPPVAAPAAPAGPTPDLSEFPGDPRLAEARAAFGREDFRAALRLAREARRKGADPAALAAEAEIFRVTSYLDHEIHALRAWAKAAPADWTPWLKLFYVYLDLHWKREADGASRRVLALAPGSARAHVARAVFCYSTAVDPRDALAGVPHARRALELDSGSLAYKNLYGTVLLRANRWREAEAVFRDLTARAPERTENTMLLYRAVLLQGRKREAEAVLAELARREPGNVEAAYEQGVNAFERKDFEAARVAFEPVLARDPRYARVAYYLGQVYLRQGRAAEGRRLVDGFRALDRNATAFQTAQFRLASRPNDPASHRKLGELHLASGDYPRAVVELRRALELRPNDADARAALRKALKRQNRDFEAEQLFLPAPKPITRRTQG